MNNTITGILALVIIVLVGFLYYIENFKVPNLEQRIQDLKEAPVERDTVYAKGKTDTL